MEEPLRRSSIGVASPWGAYRLAAVLMVPVLLGAWGWQVASERKAAHQARFVDDLDHPGAMAREPGFEYWGAEDASIVPPLVSPPLEFARIGGSTCTPSEHNDEVQSCRSPVDGVPEKRIVVVGDSHMQQFLAPLGPIARQRNWEVTSVLKGGCPFSSDSEFMPGDPGCLRWNADVLAELLVLRPDLVLANGTRDVRVGLTEVTPPGFVAHWRTLAEAGIRVAAVRDNPRFPFSPSLCAAEHGPEAPRCGAPKAELYAADPPYALLDDVPGTVTFLDFGDCYCTADFCPPVIGNVFVYLDDNHVTATYQGTMSAVVERAPEDLLDPQEGEAGGRATSGTDLVAGPRGATYWPRERVSDRWTREFAVVTLGDVARHAGVARSTVSYVLTGNRSVSPQTRSRVERSIRALDYARSAAAPAERVDRMALVLSESLAPRSSTRLVDAVVDAADRHGLDVLLVTADRGEAGLRRAARKGQVDGLVAVDVQAHDPRLPLLRASRLPVVAIGAPASTDGVLRVDFDLAAAMAHCLDHLVGLGHRSVGFLGAPSSAYRRETGFAGRTMTAFAAAALRRDVEHSARPVDGPLPRALAGLLGELPGATALVVHNESVLGDVPAALRALGRHVPHDVAVVAVCADEVAERLSPPVTSVHLPVAEAGDRAVRVLVAALAGQPAPGPVLVAPHLSPRRSSVARARAG
ncbi:substrate-binding domain-containing protein [Saccharothrix yanglingensis]|uniref:substrate-binding domain-containing protein n=1 Tax=Saccharothrix yanglingensis TaxID=659496 RepID=UPI0027D2AD1A|nr:substrate-binding domain-containing protein [Saccharothrix yanglingensis]